MELAVDSADHGAGTILSVRGELDIATAPLLRDAVDKAVASSPPLVLIDLTALGFLDSTGCRELMRTAKAVESTGTTIAVVCPVTNRRVRRIVDFMQLDALLPVHEQVPPA